MWVDNADNIRTSTIIRTPDIKIKKVLDKIKKIYNLLEYDTSRRDDFAIVEQIRQEYIDTKKMPKSTMLYLNKVYKELKVKKEDDDDQKF